MAREQGVSLCVLTPHFYRYREHAEDFLERRKQAARRLAQAILTLPPEEQQSLPKLRLGAEVAWVPNLPDLAPLEQLCIDETRLMLLELPFTPWNGGMIDQIYDAMGRTGITPVIAHLERYLRCQKKEMIREVLELGVPVQISAEPLRSPLERRSCLQLLRRGQAQFLASDCHDADGRPPNLSAGFAAVEKKLGPELAAQLAEFPRRLLKAEALNV